MVADVIVAIASHRPRDGRRRPMTHAAVDDKTYAELQEIAARYPEARSGLLPMLHLVQSVEGRITPEGIEACADILGITAAEVSGVATFYTMYKRKPGRRLPRRRLHQHAVRGDGRRRDLRAAQGPPRRRQRRDHRRRQGHPRAHRVQRGLRLRAGDDGQLGVHGQHDPRVRDPAGRRPARRAPRSTPPAARASVTWREAERVLAGFPDGLADEGPAAGPAVAGRPRASPARAAGRRPDEAGDDRRCDKEASSRPTPPPRPRQAEEGRRD